MLACESQLGLTNVTLIGLVGTELRHELVVSMIIINILKKTDLIKCALIKNTG